MDAFVDGFCAVRFRGGVIGVEVWDGFEHGALIAVVFHVDLLSRLEVSRGWVSGALAHTCRVVISASIRPSVLFIMSFSILIDDSPNRISRGEPSSYKAYRTSRDQQCKLEALLAYFLDNLGT